MKTLTKKEQKEATELAKQAEASLQLEKLTVLGLTRGDKVRFSRVEGGKWITGKVSRVEKDGSLGLSCEGRSRCVQLEYIEKEVVGPRGGSKWEPICQKIGNNNSQS